MPDGQDKSDDLIAELAKLMASNTTPAPEPEGNSAPKLVTLPDAPQTAAPAPIRIPGMDSPATATPQVQSAPTVTPPPAQSAPAQPAPVTPGVLRIPGMDRPVSVAPAGNVPTPSIGSAPAPSVAASPAPTVSAAPVPVAPRPVEAKPAASFDFGSSPAATTFKPEPMSSWQDREIPKPVPSHPAPPPASAAPEPPKPVAPAVSPGTSAISSVAMPKAEAPSPRVEPSITAPTPKPGASAPAPISPMVEAAKASPAADNFDFDFGFATNPPEPIGGQASKPAPAAAPPAASSEDPIADLIAAELDSADAEAAQEQQPRPAQPAPRSFPQPGGGPAPQQRPVQAAPVPFRPNQASVPAQPQVSKPEDRFGVAPVFGPAGRSQVAARPQQPASDPMEEIESLIGEAVRVELTTDKPTPAPAPVPAAPMVRANAQSAPAVPPLTAGIPPRRAAIKDKDGDVGSAEAAILAAAAASGAEVGRLDSLASEPGPYKRVKAKPERRSGGMRQYVGMAVAGTLLLAAGFGLYWVLGMGRGSDADAPVLTADATPVKEVPPPAPATTTTQQGAVVFNELGGGNATVPADEQLVSRDDSAETSVADVARTVGEGGEAASESELANRKVRTVTVRPDGTIVSGDEAVAGNEELPVDRPNVPDLPGADVQPSELLASMPADPSAADAAAATGGQPLPADPTQVAALAPSPGATIDPSIVAPIPVARPSNRAALGGGASSTVASTQPVDLAASQPAAAAPVAAAPAAPSGSGPYVQLSSQPSQADAENALRSTQNRLANILGGRSLAVRQVDLGAKGTWYRVVLPVPTFQDATDTCAGLKNNGIDCVPIGG